MRGLSGMCRVTPAGQGVSVSPQRGEMRGRGAEGRSSLHSAGPGSSWNGGLEPELGGNPGRVSWTPNRRAAPRTRSKAWAPPLGRMLGSLDHKAGQGPREPPTQET